MQKRNSSHRRSLTVGFRLDAKLGYLLTIAARDTGCSVSGYLEQALRMRLAAQGDGAAPLPIAEPVWGDDLWAEDEADRLFLLSTRRFDLLTVTERQLWKLLAGSILPVGKSLTVTEFRRAFHAAYSDPMVDKTLLDEEVSA